MMTDDIVTRLRESFSHPDVFTPAMFLDAADEIMRLRADRDRWRMIADKLANEVDAQILDVGLELYREAVENG
jgi:hypothetical protein